MFHTHILLLAGVYLPLVAGSVYPTQPIQATVWSADRPMLVSWVEDWTYPVLSEMGLVDITLWRDTNTFLVQLASGVDPMTKTCQVTVPTAVLNQGSKYTLRFTTTTPIDAVIYSADFVIVPANANTTGTNTTGTMTSALGGVPLATQNGTFGTGSATAVPSNNTTSDAPPSCTATSSPGSMTPSGLPPPSGTIPNGGEVPGQGQGQGQDRAANAGRKAVDMEKLKFRFVFVIWPVLMGITMAL